MRELELARGSKTDLVKEIMAQRDGANHETTRLKRHIAEISRKLGILQEEHLQVFSFSFPFFYFCFI